MTGPAADSVFVAAGPPGSCFALLLLAASVDAEWERLVPAVSCSLSELSSPLRLTVLVQFHWRSSSFDTSVRCRLAVL